MPCRSSHLAHQHWRCQRGNVSIVFGLMFVVMMTAIGAAVDIGRALSAQSHLQGLLDAAVLTAAAKSRTVGSNAQQDGATAFMHTWNGRHGAATPELSFTREDGGVFKASARSSVPTSIVQLIGIPRIEILGEAHVKSKSQTAEIALVMDNTFSMSGSKITTLKRSARLLVETVFDGVTQPGSLKMSLVPFTHYVNVGMSNRNESWISVEPDSSTTSQSCAWNQPTRCVRSHTENYTQYIDGVPVPRTRTVCDERVNDGPAVWRCTTNTSNRRWSGCVGSRPYPLNTQDGSYGTRVPGMMNTTCGNPITPLTDDEQTLLREIDRMTASSSNTETYVQPGVLWGMNTLSSQEPFGEGVPPGTDGVRKIMVLMTDGANTRSPNYPAHNNNALTNSTHRATANQLTAETCAQAKAADIEIFSIAFDIDDPVIKDVIRNCASSPSKFMDAQDEAQLLQAFSDISAYIRDLFLSH